MKANVLYNINDLRYTDYKTPEIKEDEVMINVKAAGICGSDIARVFKTGTYHFPTIIGHEFSGLVVQTGNKTNSALLNQRVAVFPLIPCKQCEQCKKGNYELCSHYNYLGSRCDGGFAEYVAAPAWNLLPIPDSVSYESAAMLEPASVAMHAFKRSQFLVGEKVVIFGPGTIGMILAQIAKNAGASRVVLIGRHQQKLDFAHHLLNVETFNSSASDFNEQKEHLSHEGFDIVFEGTGADTTLSHCIEIVKPMGRIVTLGNPIGDFTLEKNIYWKILRKQLTITGTWNSGFGTAKSDWNTVLSMITEKKLNLEGLITQRYKLHQLKEGLQDMVNPNVYTNKVMTINY